MAKAKPTPIEEISEDLAGAELTLDAPEVEQPKVENTEAEPKVDYVNDNDNFVFDEKGNCLGHKNRGYRSLSKK